MKTNPVLGITCGDPNGIGPEIISKTLSASDASQPVVLFADPAVFKEYALDIPPHVHVVSVKNGFRPTPGKMSAESGRYCMLSLELAVQYAKSGLISGIVTAPISKEAVNLAGWHIPGHTEWLAEQFNAEVLMILASSKLKVGLVTGHVPLSNVAGLITEKAILSTAQRMHKALRRDFNIQRPSLAILGLNPHAGDGGVLGREEIEIIAPAIKKLNESGIFCSGPFAADGFFGSESYLSHHGVIAMYHDQGLAAFKAISFGDGVNVTAGLPIVRTSPDHGTAFAIAGTGKADASSFHAAFVMARDLCSNRLRQTS
jgi:4-hydroxythreonine-4-phosphate dehydrogenase